MYEGNQNNPLKTVSSITAPNNYWTNKNLLSSQLNSCGGNGISSDLVPDHLFGTDITDACNIHDYMYLGESDIKSRQLADQLFLDNMLAAVDKTGSNLLFKTLRSAKAYLYYFAVRIFGGFYFNKGH